MTSYILLVAAVILLCLSLNKMSNKLGIPMLLAYILLGMMFGTDGILKIPLIILRLPNRFVRCP